MDGHGGAALWCPSPWHPPRSPHPTPHLQALGSYRLELTDMASSWPSLTCRGGVGGGACLQRAVLAVHHHTHVTSQGCRRGGRDHPPARSPCARPPACCCVPAWVDFCACPCMGWVHACVRASVSVRVRASVCACVRACMRASLRVCVRACVQAECREPVHACRVHRPCMR